MPINHAAIRLGKKPPVEWPLKMADFMKDDLLPTPPSAFSNSRGVTNFGMMLNDNLGCCVIAAKFHALQTLIMSQISSVVPQGLIGTIHPDDSLILRYYENWAGYVPSDPSTDNGYDMTSSWKRAVAEGVVGYKFLGFTDPNPKNKLHIMQSIYLFGGVDIGLALPVEWQGAKVWDVVEGAERGSWGGHDVWTCDYTPDGVYVITWGERQFLTWEGLAWACDEAHTPVSDDFSPVAGFNLPGLLTALPQVSA